MVINPIAASSLLLYGDRAEGTLLHAASAADAGVLINGVRRLQRAVNGRRRAVPGALGAALAEGGIEAAKDVCRETRGPVASIFYQGLLRYEEGVDVVEKTIVSYGSVQMSLMEDGMTWISLFIALAPSLGFLGTVVGMIQAFDAIQAAGDISPNVVAGGMKVALITTVFGLIVAMILQVFYNYILTRIESLTTDMEDSSISFVDVLTKFAAKTK